MRTKRYIDQEDRAQILCLDTAGCITYDEKVSSYSDIVGSLSKLSEKLNTQTTDTWNVIHKIQLIKRTLFNIALHALAPYLKSLNKCRSIKFYNFYPNKAKIIIFTKWTYHVEEFDN
jgi:hypothetical protein